MKPLAMLNRVRAAILVLLIMAPVVILPAAAGASTTLAPHYQRLVDLLAEGGTAVADVRQISNDASASVAGEAWKANSTSGTLILFVLVSSNESILGVVRGRSPDGLKVDDTSTWGSFTTWTLSDGSAASAVTEVMHDAPVLPDRPGAARSSPADPVCQAVAGMINGAFCPPRVVFLGVICDGVLAVKPVATCPGPATGRVYNIDETDYAPLTYPNNVYGDGHYPVKVWVAQENYLCKRNPAYPNDCRQQYGNTLPFAEWTAMVNYRRTIHWPSGPKYVDFTWSGRIDFLWPSIQKYCSLSATFMFHRVTTEIEQLADQIYVGSPPWGWYSMGEVQRQIIIHPDWR